VWEAQATRLARRMDVGVPPRPKGIVGVYDVSDDWIPIYDRTSLGGFYVAIGTSGNQFKNAPVIGQLLRAVIDGVEAGRDHDNDPVRWTGTCTGLEINLGHYSRRRERNPDSSNSVLG
jgi:glycine/D-amino acid oxidase-like deaminating enzyme